MKNHLKELLDAGKVAVGTQLRMSSPAIAELVAAIGFDYIIMDGEHAPQTPTGVLAQMHAVQGYSCTPIMRLGKNDPDDIRLYLDMGAGGVLIPLVSTPAEAEKAAKATRLPPRGTRSYGPSRAYHYGLDTDYMETVNDSVLCMIIIETAEAVENIDAILAVDDLDAVIVGPADLSISLGVPMQMRHEKVEAATEKVIAAGHKAGKPVGIGFYGADMELMGKRVAQGARIILAGMDEGIVKEGYSNLYQAASPLK